MEIPDFRRIWNTLEDPLEEISFDLNTAEIFLKFFVYTYIFCNYVLNCFVMKFKIFVFQILTEQVCTQVVHKPHPEPDSTVKIQNPSERTALPYRTR